MLKSAGEKIMPGSDKGPGEVILSTRIVKSEIKGKFRIAE